MSAIRTIFWDVGGVLLTNAWDHTERTQALERFHLNAAEFQTRHDPLVPPFERGQLKLDDYLDRTVFYTQRPFTRDEFRSYMFTLTKPFPDVLKFAQSLSDSGKYFMATINNESRELNNYRIETFGLRKMLRVFFSSCYVGLRKPESDIYRLALEVTQMPADQCCFIDDRAANLEAPAKMGMHTIQMQTVEQLRGDLQKFGVTL